MTSPPRVLLVGGLEPTGRMGLLADVCSVTSAGGRPVAVAALLTGQGRGRLEASPVSSDALAAQLRGALEEPLAAIKVGALGHPEQLTVLLELLPRGLPWVIDPVTRSSSGGRLSELQPSDFARLAIPLSVVTPNVDELRWLANGPGDAVTAELEAGLEAAREVDPKAARGHDAEAAQACWASGLLGAGFGAVVLKGGHARGAPRERLYERARGEGCGLVIRTLGSGPRLPRGPQVRGTGCRFASTLATRLGAGCGIEEGVRSARRAVRAYLRGCSGG